MRSRESHRDTKIEKRIGVAKDPYTMNNIMSVIMRKKNITLNTFTSKRPHTNSV